VAAIPELDKHLAEVARILWAVPKPQVWLQVGACVRITPDGRTSTQSYKLVGAAGAAVEGWSVPDAAADAMYDHFKRCWKQSATTSKPWYEATLHVRPDGQFSVDFAYRDHYLEGDIMRE